MLNALPRSLDQCLDTAYSSNQSILSVLYFCPVFFEALDHHFHVNNPYRERGCGNFVLKG